MLFATSNIIKCIDVMKLSMLPNKNSENLDMIYDIHKTWVIGKDDFGSNNLT